VNEPPPNRHSWRRARRFLPALFGLLVLAGCVSNTKHKWLNLFFDGVPDPNAPKITNGVARIEYDEDGRPMTPIIRGTNFGVVKGSPFTPHAPYDERKCSECHESRFSVKMKAPLSQVCFACHEDFLATAKFKHTPADNNECSECHNSHGSQFPKLLVKPVTEICSDCHEDQKAATAKSAHQPYVNAECAACHSSHVSQFKGLLTKAPGPLCADCHEDTKPSLKVVHQPYENGDCLSCHAPHNAVNKNLLTKVGKANCLECHDDFTEKAKFKHTVVDDCSACHASHKSAGPKMLIKATAQEMCLDCHEEADMAKIPAHGGNALLQSCVTCHEVHVGENKFLVKPAALPAAQAKP
jgi:predicted CXXCH cytochrome family protein